MGNTEVTLCGVHLDNPVIPASGTFGYGYEFSELYDINILGSISVKGTTAEPRFGNPTPRIAECASGMLNSVGLQNPGADKVLSQELPRLRECFHKPVMMNVSGFSADGYVSAVEILDVDPCIGWFEINISCPNVKEGGIAFGQNPKAAEEITRAVKKYAKQPVIMKLSPNVTDITEMARAVEAGGADAVSLINTLTGMKIDINRKTFAIANKTGGVSGPIVHPIAVRMVYQVAQAVGIPIIGMGGISCAEDAIEFILAGASAVSIGTSNFHNPAITLEVIDGIEAYMRRHGFESVKDMVGIVK